jgi:hypothetical protein
MVPVWELQVVKSLVRTHAKCGSARETAKKMKLPHKDVLRFLDWLWAYQQQGRRATKYGCGMNRVTAEQYLAYLYENNVSIEAATAAVQWPRHMVWRAVGGQQQWSKQSHRTRLRVPAKEPEYRRDDPTPEQVAAMAAEIRAGWTPAQLAAQEGRTRYEAPSDVPTGMVHFD